MAHHAMHEQPAIAREQGAIVSAACGEGEIGSVRSIDDIKPEQAKIARQLPEMPVRDEFCDAPLLQPLVRCGGRIHYAMDIDGCIRSQ